MVENRENETFGREIIDRKRRLWYNDSGLGRFRGERSFFVPAPKKWPLAIPSTIVKGHFCSVLVSNILVTSLSVGSAPMVSQWLICKTCIFRRIFFGVCFGSYYLGSLKFTCTLVSPRCICIIASPTGFCKTGYSIKTPQNLCGKRRIPPFFPMFPLTFSPVHGILKVLGDAERPFLSYV